MGIKNKNVIVDASLIIAFIYIWIINAWVSEDAHITFRTIEQFFAGNGLVFNEEERVQAFTHPLWMILHLPFKIVFSNLYWISLFLSFVFSISTIFLIIKFVKNQHLKILIVLTLLLSKSFVDYSSSGLENPLSFFLVSCLVFSFLGKFKITKGFDIPFLSALLVLNRPDYAVLVAPFLVYDFVSNKNSIKNIFIGLSPLLLWEIFSLFYYGSLFPNSMISKLNSGLKRLELISFGIEYLKASLIWDYITMPVIILSLVSFIILGLKKKDNKILVLVVSCIVYISGIIWAGGDYMAGRLLGIVLLMLLVCLSQFKFKKQVFTTGIVTVILLGILSPKSTFVIHNNQYSEKYQIVNGFSDERLIYFRPLGLINQFNDKYKHEWIYQGDKLTNVNGDSVYVASTIGLLPYYSGINHHFVDKLGLADPLLARLPHSNEIKFRPGHIYRYLPLGYLETIKKDLNVIKNPKISKYYSDLSTVIKGDLFSFDRLAKIVSINFKDYNLPNTYKYDEFEEIENVAYNKVKLAFYLEKLDSAEANKDWEKAIEFSARVSELTNIPENIRKNSMNALFYLVKLNRQNDFFALAKSLSEVNYKIKEEFWFQLAEVAENDGQIDFASNIYRLILYLHPDSKLASEKLYVLNNISN